MRYFYLEILSKYIILLYENFKKILKVLYKGVGYSDTTSVSGSIYGMEEHV